MPTLRQAYENLQGDPPDSMPFLVKLLENPESPLALGGAISLRDHDYLHCIFDKGFTPAEEAFIVGLTMGNASNTCKIHYLIWCFSALFLYPAPYNNSVGDLEEFFKGVKVGESLTVKNLCTFDFSYIDYLPMTTVRKFLGVQDAY